MSEVALLIFHPLADTVTIGQGKEVLGVQGQVAVPSLSFRRRLRVVTFWRLKVKTRPSLREATDGYRWGRTWTVSNSYIKHYGGEQQWRLKHNKVAKNKKEKKQQVVDVSVHKKIASAD